MGMADFPEFVGRCPSVGAGFVAATVEKTRTRESVRPETSANRGRLAFAAGMAGHTVHGAERDALLCRRRLAADHSDGPWHIPGASRYGTRHVATDHGHSRPDFGSHASPSQRPETGSRYRQPVNRLIPDRAHLRARLRHVVGRVPGLRLWCQHDARPDLHRLAHKKCR